MAVGDSLRLHPAIDKWSLVVSSYEYNMSRKSQRTSTKHTGKTEGDFTTGAFGNGCVLARDGGMGWKRLFLANQKLEALRESLRKLGG